MFRIFFRQWLRLWTRWEWWALVLCPYIISPLFGEVLIPTWRLPIGIFLVSFFIVGLGWLLAKAESDL